MDGGAFLSEGGYGCVFRPSIPCNKQDKPSPNYVTKIQYVDFSAMNEALIGQILQRAFKNKQDGPLEKNFAPVVSTCPVETAELDVDGLSQCTTLRRRRTEDFILMDIRYIAGKDFNDYLLSLRDSSLFISTIVASYRHLLQSLVLLAAARVVHNDLKSPNVMYDTRIQAPIVIDFGLSIPIRRFNRKNMARYFYRYIPSYYLWPLEVHLINYILHRTPKVTRNALQEMTHEFTRANRALASFSKGFKRRYEELCVDYLSMYTGKQDESTIEAIVSASWRTWDTYALSVMFVDLLARVTQQDSGYLSNPFSAHMAEQLARCLDPDPKRRPTATKALKVFDSFLYTKGAEEAGDFEGLVTHAADNLTQISRSIHRSGRELAALSKKAERRR